MAYGPNQLAAGPTIVGPNLRVHAKAIFPKTVAAIVGAPLLPLLTPMAFNTATGFWVVWTNGGANGTGTIRGFIWPDTCQTSATTETLAQMLINGEVHADDVALPSGETLGNLQAALRTGSPGLRELGINIVGLSAVR